MVILWFYIEQRFKIKLTGTTAAHGDDAVAPLDSELVELYLIRPDKDCSLNDSDGTEKRKNTFQY